MAIDLSAEKCLLVRADDIGSSHAANEACLEVFRNGIARSVEIMAPCSWCEEAVHFLKECPDYDVGVHLTLTSEWAGVKWRPLTRAPSLVDADGYFFPVLWANSRLPADRALLSQDWSIEEVEAEFRAQIEWVRRRLPWTSHLTAHMGCSSISPEVGALTRLLAEEYALAIDPDDWKARKVEAWQADRDPEVRAAALIEGIRKMEPGLSILVEHPGLDTPELQATGHPGYEDVARDRASVTTVWTSPEVKQALAETGVRLVSYRDLLSIPKRR
jgi:predicted glycoside hydrolase/deacetylase ChbG (UPF0249 family)